MFINSFLNKLTPQIGNTNEENLKKWIIKQLQALPEGSRILDAGAGTQFYKQFCTHLNYVSQDFSAYTPNTEMQGLQHQSWDYGKLDIVSDITDIPEPDASFDVILCSEVLEHLPYPVKAIKEFSRLLKTRGILLMTAPFCSLTHQAPYFFSSGYSPFFYEKILDEYSFHSIEKTPNGSYFEYLAQESKRLGYISSKYTNIDLRWYQRLIVVLYLRLLNKIADNDKSSNELLCFGYFTKAIKK